MWKNIVLIFCMSATSWTLAQVDVNKGGVGALDAINGIGPVIAKRIVDERVKRGNFKDWTDFENRVAGINMKKSIQLSQAGLLVNGRPKVKTQSKSSKEK